MREVKTIANATFFSFRGFLAGGGCTTGNPMRAMEAKIVCSLVDTLSVTAKYTEA